MIAKTTKVDDDDAIRRTLVKGLAKFEATSKDARKMIRDAHRLGIHWETEIPVTDPGPRGRPR